MPVLLAKQPVGAKKKSHCAGWACISITLSNNTPPAVGDRENAKLYTCVWLVHAATDNPNPLLCVVP